MKAALVAGLLTSPIATTFAAPPRLGGPLVDGSVIRTKGCGMHFFIAYHDEYALLELLGGEMVNDGDVLQTTDEQASFEVEGRITVTNLVTQRTLDVMIDKTLLNKADFSRVQGQVCR